MNLTRWIVLTLIGAIGLVAAAPARADTEPKVNDEAKFFKPETVEKVDAELKQIKSDTGVEIVVESFPAIPESQRGVGPGQG